MTHILTTYNEKLSINDNSFSPFDLKEGYSSSRIKNVNLNKKPITKIDSYVEGVVFLAETLKEEVLTGTEKQQKKNVKQLKKLLLKFVAISAMAGMGVGFDMITTPLVAEANNLITTANATTTPTEITPSTIMDWGLIVALIVVAIGIALSISMIAFVGIYLMITRKRAEASAWNSDIIRGLIQVIVAIPLVYAIFQLAQLVFKNLPFLDGLM